MDQGIQNQGGSRGDGGRRIDTLKSLCHNTFGR